MPRKEHIPDISWDIQKNCPKYLESGLYLQLFAQIEFVIFVSSFRWVGLAIRAPSNRIQLQFESHAISRQIFSLPNHCRLVTQKNFVVI